MSKYESFSYGQRGGAAAGISPKILWTGEWSSGDINVPMAKGYTMFLIYVNDNSVVIPAFYNKIIESDNLVEHIGGMGGIAVSSSAEWQYSFDSTLDGNTLTMVNCHRHRGTGSRTTMTVNKIVGVF